MVPGTKCYVFLRTRTLNYGAHLGVQSALNVQYAHPMCKGLPPTFISKDSGTIVIWDIHLRILERPT